MTGPAGMGVPTIDPATAEGRLRGEKEPAPILLDVRESVEHSEVRAVGAVLAPLSTLGGRLDELPRDRPLFVICAVGGRSAQVTAYLLANGWTDVLNVAGGTVAWERAGLPVRRGVPGPEESEIPA
ncbi:MAG TPA: rhodanese-like domain-containing protein [Candidatus Binatia bacterium]|nr:rhodanese-like domain-containing protein [Candidatus Binatia bacterium]